ncbi:MAG: NYN domain-containing protein [Variovorax sp.]
MNDMPRVMLLIDADNVSADVIEQAVGKVLAEHRHLHVRRAYCNVETALKLQHLFKRLSVRPMTNLSTGKNSTDIALAVDAMDLVMAERPQIVYLVSSDSDFAPLVIRLREKGCRVCGIGQKGKTGDETTLVYDEFTDLQHHGAGATAAAPATPRATRAPAVKRAATTPRRAASKAAPEAAPPAPRQPALPDDVIRILDAVPELLSGGKVELNQAAERLRAARLLGKSASSPRLFAKYPDMFWLTPDKTPNKVQYIGPTSL